VVNDLAAAIDQVGFARGHGTLLRLAEGGDHFLVGIRQQREREIILLFEFLLFFHRIGAHPDHRDAFLFQFGACVTQ
jgi:hypothetical protein